MISVAGIDRVFGERGDDTVQIDHRSEATIEGGIGIDRLLIDDSQDDFNDDVPLTATITTNSFEVDGWSTSTYSEMEFVEVSLGSRVDTLTIHSTATPVNVDGSVGINASDTLILDRTHDTSNSTGVLTGDTITGIGLDEISYVDVENLVINLGSGSDEYNVENTAALTATTINAGDGDDSVTLESIGAMRLTQVNGNAGDDEAILRIPANPTEFGQLGVGVERLVVDNSTSSDSVDWKYSDGRVLANSILVVDALGAELVVFTAGVGGVDSLVVEDNVNNPQFITIEDDQVQILEGINLLQQTAAQSLSFDVTQFPTSVNGLVGALGVADSPDGNHVYVTGGAHLAVYRRQLDASGVSTNNLEFIQILVNGIDQVDGLFGAQDVVVSPDGRHVYVASSTNAIAVFERVAATGRLIYKDRLYYLPDVFTGIAMGSNHELFVTSPHHVYRVLRNPATGSLQISDFTYISHAISDIAVTPDGGDFFVATTGDIRRYSPSLDLRGVVGIGGNLSVTATNTDVYVGRTDSIHQFNRVLEVINSHSTLRSTDVTALAANSISGHVVAGLDTRSTQPLLDRLIVENFAVTLPTAADTEDWFGPGDVLRFGLFDGPQLISEVAFGVNDVGGVGPPLPVVFPGVGTSINLGTLNENRQLRIEIREQDPNSVFSLLGAVTFDSSGNGHNAAIPIPAGPFKVQYLESNVPGARQVEISGFPSPQPIDFRPDACLGQHPPCSTLGYFHDGVQVRSPISNTSEFKYFFSYDLRHEPQPGSLPAEIQLFNSNLNGTQFIRNDPGGPNHATFNPPPGATTIQDIAITNDDVSYSIDPSLSSLYVNHDPGVPLTLIQGQHQDQSLKKDGEEHATTVVFGNTAYTLSSKPGTLTYTNATTGVNRGREIVPGLRDAASLAISDNGAFIYVANPTEDSILVYSRDGASGLVSGFLGQLYDGVAGRDGLDGVDQIVIHGNSLYATSAVENTIAVYSGANTGTLTLQSLISQDINGPSQISTSDDGRSLYVSSVNNNSLVVFDRDATTGALTHRQTLTDGIDGVAGMIGPQTIVLSHDQQNVYVGGGDDTIAVLQRDVATGRLSFVQAIRNGSQGIQGLDGLSSLVLSGDDGNLFAAGADADTIAVFNRDTSTGELRYIQRVRNGSAGVVGLNNPTDLNVIGNQVLITTGGADGPSGEVGGLAYLQIDTTAPDPNTYVANYTGVESLTVRSANSPDRVSIQDIVINTVVDTRGGNDEVVIHRAPAGVSTTVNLGDDNDQAVVRTISDGAQVRLNGDAGNDALRAFSTGNGTTVFDGGANDDTFVVDGTALGADLQVVGNSGFDVLGLDAKSFVTNPILQQGLTGAPGFFEVDDHILVHDQFSGTDFGFGVDYTSIQRVDLIAAPTADAGGPYAIAEGDALELAASDLGGDPSVTFVWDLDGDGEFGEAFGANPIVPWTTLYAAGIDDDGTYQLAVRASNTQGIDEAYTTITVTNTAPTVNLMVDTSLTQYVSFVLELSAADPGDDTVIDYTVDWGDGSDVATVGGTAGSQLHTYIENGDFTITVSATDEDDGPFSVTRNVHVQEGPPPTRTLSGNASVNESEPFSLTLVAAGPGIVTSWLVDWDDGTTSTLTGSSGVLQHTYADNGAYHITAVVTDNNGAQSLATNSLNVRALNIAPVITFSGGSSAVEGTQFAVQDFSATDPGADTISQWIVEWGDGEASLMSAGSTNATHVYADDGSYVVRVGARDEDGIYVSASGVTVSVDNVTPTLGLSAANTIDEGSVYTLNLSESDPGDDTITQWRINWGDGTSTDGVPGEVVFGNPASVTHVYADGDNQYTIGATATDEDGVHVAGMTVTVNVKDVPPSPTIEGATLIPEGSQLEINFASHDPGTDPINSWTVDWGDGTTADTLAGDATSAAHTYADDGEYDIVATVNTGAESFSSDAHTMTVANVDPSIAVSGEVQNDSTQPFRLTLGDVTDPGDDTVIEYYVNWGDGSTFGDNDFETFTSNGVVEHTFEDGNDDHLIVVALVDEDGTFPGAGTLLVTNEGSPALLLLSALGDPNSRYFIQWGDESSDTYTNDDAQPNEDGLLMISAEHVYGDNGTPLIRIFIEDADNSRLELQQRVVVVNNVAPADAAISGVTDAVRGQPLDYRGGFTDAGSLDTHTLEWRVTRDDGGQQPTPITTGSGPSLNFIPTHVGDYTVHLTVMDDDGAIASTSLVVVVNKVLVAPDPEGTGETLLLVGGSTGKDKIDIKHDNVAGALEVKINEKDNNLKLESSVQQDIDRIVVFGQAGDDHIKIHKDVGAIPAELYGGAGKDHLDGGNGDDVLVGGPGDDNLHGGHGRDILIAGLGTDDLNGDNGDDILIGGAWLWETSRSANLAISAEWSRTDLPYAQRAAQIQAGVGQDLVVALNNDTVTDDDRRDDLQGKKDRDWFFANLNDQLDLDVGNLDEILNEIL